MDDNDYAYTEYSSSQTEYSSTSFGNDRSVYDERETLYDRSMDDEAPVSEYSSSVCSTSDISGRSSRLHGSNVEEYGYDNRSQGGRGVRSDSSTSEYKYHHVAQVPKRDQRQKQGLGDAYDKLKATMQEFNLQFPELATEIDYENHEEPRNEEYKAWEQETTSNYDTNCQLSIGEHVSPYASERDEDYAKNYSSSVGSSSNTKREKLRYQEDKLRYRNKPQNSFRDRNNAKTLNANRTFESTKHRKGKHPEDVRGNASKRFNTIMRQYNVPYPVNEDEIVLAKEYKSTQSSSAVQELMTRCQQLTKELTDKTEQIQTLTNDNRLLRQTIDNLKTMSVLSCGCGNRNLNLASVEVHFQNTRERLQSVSNNLSDMPQIENKTSERHLQHGYKRFPNNQIDDFELITNTADGDQNNQIPFFPMTRSQSEIPRNVLGSPINEKEHGTPDKHETSTTCLLPQKTISSQSLFEISNSNKRSSVINMDLAKGTTKRHSFLTQAGNQKSAALQNFQIAIL
jgi:hypothetical protein